jgi:hypothetical protein
MESIEPPILYGDKDQNTIPFYHQTGKATHYTRTVRRKRVNIYTSLSTAQHPNATTATAHTSNQTRRGIDAAHLKPVFPITRVELPNKLLQNAPTNITSVVSKSRRSALYSIPLPLYQRPNSAQNQAKHSAAPTPTSAQIDRSIKNPPKTRRNSAQKRHQSHAKATIEKRRRQTAKEEERAQERERRKEESTLWV